MLSFSPRGSACSKPNPGSYADVRIPRGINCAIRSNRTAVCALGALRRRDTRASREFALISARREGQRARQKKDVKYSWSRVREDARLRSAISRRGYVPSWILSNCRRPGPKYTCSYNGVSPRKEQAVRCEHERYLLCVERAPRCGDISVVLGAAFFAHAYWKHSQWRTKFIRKEVFLDPN